MKKLILLSGILLSVLSFQTNAEQPKLMRSISMMDTAKTEQSWKIISSDLDILTSKEKTNWQVFYHAAFANSLYAMQMNDMKKRDQLLDHALELAEKANTLKKDESEIFVLRGMITAMKISVDPQRGMELGPEASSLMQKGKELNPENPRAYLELGESAMYTPEEYGGGKNKAEALLKISVEKFKSAKITDPANPKWGQDRAEMLLEKCKSL